MGRYIEADKTLAFISRLLGGLPVVLLVEYEKNGIDIVRCKECVHNPWEVCGYNHCWYFEKDVDPDDYCSYGERKRASDE